MADDKGSALTHVDAEGRPSMVDVTAKQPTLRVATACARIRFPRETFAALTASGFETAKGPVIATAIVAGTMAAKRTHELIPFCHPLGLERCDVEIAPAGEDSLEVRCTAAVHHRTGVEMEALTGAAIAALAVYDMCKSLSHGIVIEETRLLEKRGGKSDFLAEPPA
ncbi:MAG TPA: cyclic pyranopterin monophosphate synthase MoaC [Steroidobacteraceae bacterium]|nr:cyclic pyranopterin monophosphate synthase MoaC [Steroidobacteraceae bacterium]